MARPRAHGHAMMSTATAAVKAADGSPVTRSQPASVASESRITIGTNTAETRSTSRCTGALPACVSRHEARDLRERRVGPDPRRPDDQAAVAVDRAARDIRPGLDVDRHRLAGEQGLIDGRGPLLDDAVGRELLAGPDDEAVSDLELVRSNDDLQAVSEHARLARAEVEERSHRLA